jgi:hypothetical protein
MVLLLPVDEGVDEVDARDQALGEGRFEHNDRGAAASHARRSSEMSALSSSIGSGWPITARISWVFRSRPSCRLLMMEASFRLPATWPL